MAVLSKRQIKTFKKVRKKFEEYFKKFLQNFRRFMSKISKKYSRNFGNSAWKSWKIASFKELGRNLRKYFDLPSKKVREKICRNFKNYV